jgi:phosphoglycolate phosphatase-like HAD superfamily hydrolase
MFIGFDLDGTLLDSRPRHIEVLRHVWPQVDQVLSDQWVHRFWECKLNTGSTKAFLKMEGVTDASRIAADWVRHIEDLDMLELDALYPFAAELLSDLSPINELYLVTARSNPEAVKALAERWGLMDFFHELHVVAPGADAGKRKAKALPTVKLDVVVGDTEADAEWAANCGARYIPVSWGFRSEKYWSQSNYKFVRDPSKLVSAIENK